MRDVYYDFNILMVLFKLPLHKTCMQLYVVLFYKQLYVIVFHADVCHVVLHATVCHIILHAAACHVILPAAVCYVVLDAAVHVCHVVYGTSTAFCFFIFYHY